jgi:hypothetical protein
MINKMQNKELNVKVDNLHKKDLNCNVSSKFRITIQNNQSLIKKVLEAKFYPLPCSLTVSVVRHEVSLSLFALEGINFIRFLNFQN